MRGDEARVVDAFCAFLEANGWQVTREVEFVDVVAHKDGATVYAEAKGRTTSPGLDVDTMYGQLLRRMGNEPRPRARYAVVVPDAALPAAKRVPTWVRSRLGIDVYVVHENGRSGVARVHRPDRPGPTSRGIAASTPTLSAPLSTWKPLDAARPCSVEVDAVALRCDAPRPRSARSGAGAPGSWPRTPPCRRRRGGDHSDHCRYAALDKGSLLGARWWFAGAHMFAEASAESAGGCAGVCPGWDGKRRIRPQVAGRRR